MSEYSYFQVVDPHPETRWDEHSMQFLEAASEQTLEQGLREYSAGYALLLRERASSEPAREFFRCHDTAHVVFGCSTDLVDEGCVKLWSMFGTTAGFGVLAGYRLPESNEIYHTLPWSDVVTTAARSVVFVPRVLNRCRKMHKRWPWSDFDAHLGHTLRDIRLEFGIQILSHG